MTERKRSKAEERSYAALLHEIEELERDELRLEKRNRDRKLKERMIPASGARIEREVPVRPRKIRVTAAFDEDLVKWFRAMGLGYQARMNAVLRAYMLAMSRGRSQPEGQRLEGGREILREAPGAAPRRAVVRTRRRRPAPRTGGDRHAVQWRSEATGAERARRAGGDVTAACCRSRAARSLRDPLGSATGRLRAAAAVSSRDMDEPSVLRSI